MTVAGIEPTAAERLLKADPAAGLIDAIGRLAAYSLILTENEPTMARVRAIRSAFRHPGALADPLQLGRLADRLQAEAESADAGARDRLIRTDPSSVGLGTRAAGRSAVASATSLQPIRPSALSPAEVYAERQRQVSAASRREPVRVKGVEIDPAAVYQARRSGC
ncbi:hypothetical protein [Chelatococcus sp. XZ-Ab1]|uniref:hypothetical protein n=1 Tax=Chelatococcus sp. XZ-Ab1 TaxID=3034027 RepID=UPI0023E36333|nr:hypothetical protein [Chelatococcus sp. XZ-Ab1]